jgi:hypothetical protein
MSLQCVLRLIEQLALPLDLQPSERPAPEDEAPTDLVASQ